MPVIMNGSAAVSDDDLGSSGRNSGHSSKAPSPSPILELNSANPILELNSAKHPLQSSWTLWYFKNDRSKQWEQNQKEVRFKNYSNLSRGLRRKLFKILRMHPWHILRKKEPGAALPNFELLNLHALGYPKSVTFFGSSEPQ
jgi:hypothetical protein